MRRILITGGAGFIGSHLADDLLARRYLVRVIDNLCSQVHGPRGERPTYLDDRVDLRVGDVRDPAAVRSALEGVDAVVHLAAAVGVGQSMYRIEEYTSVNDVGTAVLLEALIEKPVERLIVASSMSIYGEGRYTDARGTFYDEIERDLTQLKAARWDPVLPDGGRLDPVPTPETMRPSLSSVYALTKFDQERMSLLVGRAYSIPTVALRFFNVYGPRQALSNPYTGALAIFASRLLNGKRPLVFEDGHQRRDFVSVTDVATACRLALESPRAVGLSINVGSGRSVSIREAAEKLARAVGENMAPEITERYRMGDIRHCFADIRLARDVLGYRPRIDLEAGLSALAGWLRDQTPTDRADDARRELDVRGLTL